MKKYTFTFLGFSLLALLSGCNTNPTESPNAQTKKDLDLEFSKAAAEVATMSSELTATTDTNTATDNSSTDSTTSVSSDSTSSSKLTTASETSKNPESSQTNSANTNIDNHDSASASNKSEFETNAKKYPADSVATFEGAKFKGMKYLYSGKVLTKVTANSINNLFETSYLVENDRSYRMLVTPPYEVEIPDGVTLEIEGTLNGNSYDLESINLSGINKKAGLINGSNLIINGKTLGIDYFSPSDL